MAVVTFETDMLAQAYVRETKLEWPLLVDDTRSLYRGYGMEHGGIWNVYGLRVWWLYFKLFAKGRKLKVSKSDYRQLGGDVLVDPDGIVRLHYVGNGPADRPSVDSIVGLIVPE